MAFPDDVLKFWFGSRDVPDYGTRRAIWFESTEEQDVEIRDRFLATYESALAGKFDPHKESPDGCLALIVTLDQLPRNMFRGTPRAFEADPIALECAQFALERGHDESYPQLIRIFFYLPFEHSEVLSDQQRCMELIHALPEYPDKPRNIKFGGRHLEIIERFGRFPHRNAILGRTSTPGEIEFLKEPDSSFIWPRNRQQRGT
tara:strand:- start:460 stop:1068 length:609 start_codon:yes stop_codon:yes gene_type:complete